MQRVKFSHLFITVSVAIVLTTSWLGTSASFTTRVKGISADLETALGRIINVDNVTYTQLPTDMKYNSSTEFYPRGMMGLYNITKMFIEVIMSKGPLPEGILIYEDGTIKPTGDILSEWSTLLKHYGALLAIVVLCLLFIVSMPLIGLFFCCCRCCGRCGARSQPFDKKHDMCKKVFLSMVLIAITTLMLFGVVCAFVTNTYMQNGTEELPPTVHTTISDTHGYINLTKSQINTLLITNFGELEHNLNELLDTSGLIVSDKLKEYSKAVSVSQLAGIVRDLPNVSNDLLKLKNETNALRTNASHLNDGLRHVKSELLHELEKCKNKNVRECKDFNMDISKLDTTIDFNNLPDVSESLKNVTELLDSNIIEEVQKGKKAFEDIQNQIQTAVNDSIPYVKGAIADAGKAINQNAHNITNILTRSSDAIGQHTKKPVENAEHLLAQYSVYRWYAGLGISSLLLIVAMCTSCGLLCGICGRRPDGYGDDDCCNKGAGSRFLMFGVCIIFFFSSVLMTICIVAMLTGVVVQKGVCDPLRDPDSSTSTQLWSLINQLIELDKATGLHVQLSSIITSCHGNHSLYEVLNLEEKVNLNNLESYLDKYEISKKIEELKDKIVMNNDITILTKSAKEKLQKLAESGLGDIKFHRFTEILQDNITSASLPELAARLTDTANKIKGKPGLEDVTFALSRNALYLNTYQQKYVDPMVHSAQDLKETATRLENGLKFNHSSFNEAVNELLQEVEEAQEYLQEKGAEDVAEIADDFGKNLENRVREYLRRVADELKTKVGQCGPLSNAYNATLVATCDKIVLPFNGFWVSLGWCLMLFIPTIILSVKLATLYQKSDPYPGSLVEGASDKHKKKTKKHGRGPAYHQESYESQGAGYVSDAGGDRARGPVGNDGPGSSRDMRYTDMAPKHWEDFPNGGPPQYHSPPLATEYERPPPYYYPGPGNRP